MSLHNDERPIKIIIVVKKRIASWVEGRHEAWGALILLSLFAAFVEIVFASYGTSSSRHFLGVAAYALSIALAALIIGIFLGFLFGIPRTLSGNAPTQRKQRTDAKPIVSESGVTVTVAGSDGGESSSGNGNSNFGVNTNLEQISDWLTKIMVGVGLTQIAKMPGAIKVMAEALKPGFGEIPGAGTLGVLIVLFFSVCGFLIGYLWTRIYLTKEFVNAEFEATAKLAAKVSTMESANERVAAALSSVEAQPNKDALALSMVQKHLDPVKGEVPIDEKTLTKALQEGSPALKVQVFYLARKLRKDAKNTSGEKKAAARVIPIFRALNACDEDERYHRTHAQLAYALLDQEKSDVQAAIVEIEKAMAVRDGHGTAGYLNYEVFRAVCRMLLMGQATTDAARSTLREQIQADLRAAGRADIDYLREDPKVLAWMAAEGVSEKDLLA